ncbi:aromatic amino acid ammonia-lyase [Aspergillus saccharolyticus JOP 1030-1]|uniref:Phenylalanine ammonia-lyase n=1 Tax=Aspergillus saccharolyticus JOP 1030-1 TaxID=1450539 RepID=A0A318Z0Z1_9EURO|nr:phenylalanine ammonia-lyase [Aspergillus saccharolyticus JOP 1030-1]PYH40579.1 phenylalanine ammonia-lyase [Aspergillus saccharolyticus JOP 1030-1]
MHHFATVAVARHPDRSYSNSDWIPRYPTKYSRLCLKTQIADKSELALASRTHWFRIRMQPFKFHTSLVVQQWKLCRQLAGEPEVEVIIDGDTLDIPHVVYVARHVRSVRIAPTAYAEVNRGHNALLKSLSSGEVIYGVNTGFGASAHTRTKDVQALQRVLTRELGYGILPPGSRDVQPRRRSVCEDHDFFDLAQEEANESYHLPMTWVRGAMLLRLNTLIRGHSAIRPVILDQLQALLAHNIVPMAPLRGSISASGDLSPLAYISSVIQGKPTVRVFPPAGHAQDLYADEALAGAGIAPVDLTAKEGLAIVNGTAISAACGALVLHDVQHLAVLAQVLTAMTVEALLGSPESFQRFFAEVRPHPGQMESARNIRAFLRGSKLAQNKDGKDGALRQDRYSVRTAAQWLGPVLEDLLLAHQQMSIECNSTTDNPLVTHEGEFLHGGNFQAKAVTAAMEKSRQGIQSIGRMLYTQCQEMINPATSWGLTPNLVAEEPSKSGIFKAIDIYISALQSELGFLAGPVNHVNNAEMGNQSLNSLALISARYTATGVRVLTEIIAAHFLSACQALDLRAMQLQFLESVRDPFSALLNELVHNIEPSVEGEEQSCTIDTEALAPTLWLHLGTMLVSTVTMDTTDRFVHIAKSMRVPILDCVGPSVSSPKLLGALQRFVEATGTLLLDAWCVNRDAYMIHGDASAYLGVASKKVYAFVRRTLGVPFLCTAQILTPTAEAMQTGQRREAPTVGSYTAVIYRAIRRGEMIPLMLELLEECLAEHELAE